MRAVIRVIDTAAVITGAVTLDICGEVEAVSSDTPTHMHNLGWREAELFFLKASTLVGQPARWQQMRWGTQKQTERQIKSRRLL